MPLNHVTTGQETIAVQVTERFREKNEPFFWPLIGDYPLYDRYIYLVMLADPEREAAYESAIRRHCLGKIVVDVGTGDTAVWALTAARAGARKVYALEENATSVARAREVIAEGGFSDVIEVLEGRSDTLLVKETADLMISEVIGEIGGSEGTAAVLNDVRKRWLKPGARSIPARCLTWACPVELPDEVMDHPQLELMGRRYVEQIFQLAGHPFDLRLTLDNCFPEIESGLLASPSVVENLDFSDECPTDYETTHRFEITRSGRFDGIILWIELFADEIEPGISSMTPGSNWRPVFLPLFSPGTEVAGGDEIILEWSSRLSEDHHHPDYAVKATLHDHVSGPGNTCTTELRLPRYGTAADFRQNPFYEKLFPSD